VTTEVALPYLRAHPDRNKIVCVSGVPADGMVMPGQLSVPQHVRNRRRWKERLGRARVQWFLGATDWSFNEHAQDRYRWRPPGQDRYIIKCDAFNALFATSSQRDIVLNWLTETHQITAAVVDAGESPHERTPKRQFFWPDGKRRRSYEIVFARD
jgi:hypothetical protein